jgi:glycosyltransferase involved in cell wall biosynthesis
MPGWSIVVPMYQEETRIVGTVEQLAASALATSDNEFVFVDDGSSDRTVEVLEKALAQTDLVARVIRLPRNLGKGAAVQAGVLASRGEVIAYVDADLSSPPSAIEQCCRAVAAGVDVAVASRGHATSNLVVRQPGSREAAGKLFNRVVRLLGLTTLPDTQCGLKAFERTTARAVFADLSVRRFAFDVEVLMRAARRGATIEAIPTEWAHREESRVAPLTDGARMLWDALRLAAAARRAAPTSAGSPGGMASATFDVMHRVEREHWWFKAKRDIVRAALAEQPGGGVAVDVGCGTGAVLHDLAELGFAPLLGTDLDAHALRLVAGDAGAGVGLARAVAEALPLRSESVDVRCSLVVVEHLDDDVLALREYLRVLRPSGRLVITVPAYRWAWSAHDVDLGHRRRYTRPRIEAAAAAAGFDVVTSRYFHSWLVPIAWLLRKTPLRAVVADKPAESVSMGGPLQNTIGHRLSAIDRRVVAPFGLSILLVARRPAA